MADPAIRPHQPRSYHGRPLFTEKLSHRLNSNKGLNDFDWSQVRVYFVAPQYSKYQIHSINFSNLPMELWKIKRFEQDIIQFEQVKPTDTSSSISGYVEPVRSNTSSGRNNVSTEPGEEVIVYTEDDRLNDGSNLSRELYYELRDYIMSLDDNIGLKATKLYISFKLNNHNFIDIKLQSSQIVLWLNTSYGTLDDPRHLITDVTHIGHHGIGDCQIKVSNTLYMGYIKDLILAHYVNKS